MDARSNATWAKTNVEIVKGMNNVVHQQKTEARFEGGSKETSKNNPDLCIIVVGGGDDVELKRYKQGSQGDGMVFRDVATNHKPAYDFASVEIRPQRT